MRKCVLVIVLLTLGTKMSRIPNIGREDHPQGDTKEPSRQEAYEALDKINEPRDSCFEWYLNCIIEEHFSEVIG